MGGRKIIISCEHAGKYIPNAYLKFFEGKDDVLNSHRGWDVGTLEIGKYVARILEAPFFFQKASRLLIEANRSLDNSELFSEFTAPLSDKDKEHLIATYYRPYRNEVEKEIELAISKGETVIHISVHSFTPVLNGVERSVDVGILFDEKRELEQQFSIKWKEQLSTELPDLLVMLNLPYNGADDGFTTYLRTRFEAEKYLGIELEINQKYAGTPVLEKIKKVLVSTLN
ncbi:MAG TPA: N-formylglutamate amidohydrolase [Fulvivirga sp.]|nr:N-formylglutamate amidohydrolase [Fulvivirga sp.]